jgi:hypothetical protein
VDKPKTITISREQMIAQSAITRDWRQKQIKDLSAEGLLADLRIEMEYALRVNPKLYGIGIKRRFTG